MDVSRRKVGIIVYEVFSFFFIRAPLCVHEQTAKSARLKMFKGRLICTSALGLLPTVSCFENFLGRFDKITAMKRVRNRLGRETAVLRILSWQNDLILTKTQRRKYYATLIVDHGYRCINWVFLDLWSSFFLYKYFVRLYTVSLYSEPSRSNALTNCSPVQLYKNLTVTILYKRSYTLYIYLYFTLSYNIRCTKIITYKRISFNSSENGFVVT